ncbi:hypothetical protein Q2941_35705 [Bradyrhizobium sp. UFLA05-153]
MANIDMNKVIPIAEGHEIWAARGKAIQAYANLEQSFATLFAGLSDTSIRTAAIVLFRITNSDARNKILEKLFRQKFQEELKEFRKSLFSQLRPIDIERNEIVHWNAACHMGLDEDGQETANVFLMPPASLTAVASDTPTKDIHAIKAFSAKCRFYSSLINMFCSVECRTFEQALPDEVTRPWRDIFAREIVYPPPMEHPLFPQQNALENYIQAFIVR